MQFRVKWFKLIDEVIEAKSIGDVKAKIAPNSWKNDPDVQGDYLHSIQPLDVTPVTGNFPNDGGTPGTPVLDRYEMFDSLETLDLSRKAA